jgi:hypothetical protein
MVSKKKLGVVVVLLVVALVVVVAVVSVGGGGPKPSYHIQPAVVPASEMQLYVGSSVTLSISELNSSNLPFELMGLPVVSGMEGTYTLMGNYSSISLVIYSLELQSDNNAKNLFQSMWYDYNGSVMILGSYYSQDNGTYDGFRYFVGSVPYSDAGSGGTQYTSAGINGQYMFIINFMALNSNGPSQGLPQAEINAMVGA